MRDFRHYNAASVAEAVSLLKKFDGKAMLNAGGTDLLGTLKADILPQYPEAVVNVKTIPKLAFINNDGNCFKIGATTKLTDMIQSPEVRNRFNILVEAAKSVASPEIQNMATVAGNLCQDTRCWYYRYPHNMGGRIACFRKGGKSCPAVTGDNRYHAIFGGKKCFAVCPSDLAVALSALDASVVIAGSEGERAVPVMEFYQTLGPVLKPDEMVTQIEVPQPAQNKAQAFFKFRVREAVDFAIVSLAVAVSIKDKAVEDARIVLGAVAPTPYRAQAAENALNGQSITALDVDAVAEAAVTGAKPLAKNGYKVEIVKALVKRALEKIASER